MKHLFVVAIFLLTCESAIAAANDPCVAESEFLKRGGHFIQINTFNFDSLPYNFNCDFVPCYGVVKFQGRVDENGKISRLVATENDWEDRPKYHADVLSSFLATIRYAPLYLRGKQVCVERRWEVGFSPKGRSIFR